jgi:type I restriction enzyme S subunit
MEYITVKELFKITKGKKVEEIDYKNENSIRYIQIDDLRNNNNIKHCENINKYVIAKKEDIIIAWDGANAGTIGFGIEGAIGSTLAILRKENKEMDTEFCGLFLRSKSAYLREKCTGATIPHIQRRALEDIKIPKISLNKQIEIKNIINKAQELIDKRKEQIQDLDELVKSQFIEMFGNPSINDKGWMIDKLSTVVTNIENGKSFICESFSRSGKYPAILKLSAVTYGIYNANENKALTDESLYVSSVEVKSEDLLFTRKNTPELVGMSAYVYNTEPNLMMPDLIFRFNTNENINKIYLWKLINHDLFREKIKSLSNGSAKSMSNISKQRLMELNIPIPPIELQKQFADFVKQTDKLKFEMEKSLKELEDNFNALMQKAFNGELFN